MSEANDIRVRFKLGRYFEPGSHKVVLDKGHRKRATPLPQLISDTNSFSTKNRPGCQPSLEGSNPKDLFLAYNVKCNLETSDPNGHAVKVHFDVSEVRDETTAKNLDVAVSCSCPAFLYWGGQWNTHQRDALEGEPRPLLTAPTERMDLRNHFVVCKHIKAVSERILPSVQHNIVKILRKRKLDAETDTPAPPKSRLEEKQREMRERQKKQKQKNKPKGPSVREKLEQGIRQRELDDVVRRDTPATPEEKQRVPVLPPGSVPIPDAHKEHLESDAGIADIPEIAEFNDPAPQPPQTPPSPAPRKPQTLPRMGPGDRDQMRQLQKEDQKRQQREIEQRLRNDRGSRR